MTRWKENWLIAALTAIAILASLAIAGCAPARWQKGTTVIVLTTEPIQEQPTTNAWDVLVNIGDIPEDTVSKLPLAIFAERTVAHAATHRTSGFIFTNRPTGDTRHKFTITVKKNQEVEFTAEPVPAKE